MSVVSGLFCLLVCSTPLSSFPPPTHSYLTLQIAPRLLLAPFSAALNCSRTTRTAMELQHISKSGGTSMCRLAMEAGGLRTQNAGMLHNCLVGQRGGGGAVVCAVCLHETLPSFHSSRPTLLAEPLLQIPAFEDIDQLGRPSDPLTRFYVPEVKKGHQPPPIYSRLGREVDPNPARKSASTGTCNSHHRRESTCETRCGISTASTTRGSYCWGLGHCPDPDGVHRHDAMGACCCRVKTLAEANHSFYSNELGLHLGSFAPGSAGTCHQVS